MMLWIAIITVNTLLVTICLTFYVYFPQLRPVSSSILMPVTKLVSGAEPDPPLPDGFCNEEKKTPTEIGYNSLQWKFDEIRQAVGKGSLARSGWTQLEEDARKCFENPSHCTPVNYAVILPPDSIAVLAEKTYIVPVLQSSGGYGCACGGEYTYKYDVKYGTLYCKFSTLSAPDFIPISYNGLNFNITKAIGNITVHEDKAHTMWDTLQHGVQVYYHPKSVFEELTEILKSIQKTLNEYKDA